MSKLTVGVLRAMVVSRQWVAPIVIGGLVAPVIALVMRSVWPLSQNSIGFNWESTLNTVGLAAAVAICSTVGGAVLAFAVECVRFPLRHFALGVLTIPFLMPPHIVALAIASSVGGSSEFGWAPFMLKRHAWVSALCVAVLCYTPLAMWVLLFAVKRLPSRCFEMALLYVPVQRAVRTVVFPMLRRDMAAVGIVVFVIVLQSFDICSVVGCESIMTEVVFQAATMMSTAAAMSAAIPLVLCAMIGSILFSIGLPDHGGDQPPVRRGNMPVLRLARWEGMSIGVLIVVSLVAACLPLWNLIHMTESFSALLGNWRSCAGELLASGKYAVWATLVIMVLTGLIVPWMNTQGTNVRRLAWCLLFLSFGVPSSVLSMCYVETLDLLHVPLARDLFTGSVRISTVLAARYLFVAVLIVLGCGTSAKRRNKELAAIAALPGSVTWWHIRLPSIGFHWAAAATLVFALTFRELELYILNAPPGGAPLPVRIFNSLHFGTAGETGSMCILLVLAAIGPMVLARISSNRND